MTPKVSIILPVYNGYIYISECLDSLICQDFNEFEIIIIDDGSTDDSIELLRNYESLDTRIRLYRRENKGLSFTLRELVEKSRSNLIVRVDIDDICHPSRISKQYTEFQANDKLVLHYSNVRYIDFKGDLLGYSGSVLSNYAIKKSLLKGNCIFHPSVMFRKDAYHEVGGYDQIINKYFEDYLLWLKMINLGEFKCSHSNLIDYRILSSSVSRSRTKGIIEVYNKIIAKGGKYDELYDEYLSAINIKIESDVKVESILKKGYRNKINKYTVIFSKEIILRIRGLFCLFY
ncbi:glycosyltransferase family 2 protein [Photobacterium phosphoreum]|uniref:glycosyltransferase family 2 protein n=1 Tax=Photobacterium phosphoreum TaxID=659 RepID=UPI0039B04C1F